SRPPATPGAGGLWIPANDHKAPTAQRVRGTGAQLLPLPGHRPATAHRAQGTARKYRPQEITTHSVRCLPTRQPTRPTTGSTLRPTPDRAGGPPAVAVTAQRGCVQGQRPTSEPVMT